MMARNTSEDKEISDSDSHETKKSSESVGASEDSWESDFERTLKSWKSVLEQRLKDVTDAFNKDRENGKVTSESHREVLNRRGQQYEAMLRSARLINPTRSPAKEIEEYVVSKVETDGQVYAEGLEACKKIECWAAKQELVNVVMALIRRGGANNGSPSRGLLALAIAAEDDKHAMVKTLTELAGAGEDFEIFDLDKSSEPQTSDKNRNFFYNIAKHGSVRTVNSLYPCHEVWLCPIEAAARLGHHKTVKELIALTSKAMKKKRPQWRPALDWAVKMGREEVVKYLIENDHIVDLNKRRTVNGLLDKDVLKVCGRCHTPLTLAVLSGHFKVVKVLCEATKGGLRTDVRTEKGKTAIEMTFKGNSFRSRVRRHYYNPFTERHARDEIWKQIMDRADSRRELKRLTEERKVHVDAINAILVGTALIATATFAGWLSPPLGYSSPPGTDGPFASVEGHPILEKFWVFNSLSFFFSIATFMVGANVALPPRRGDYIGDVVQSLRWKLTLAYYLVSAAVAFVIGAFASAGFVVLPPIRKYTVNMAVTVGIGVTVVAVVVLSTFGHMFTSRWQHLKLKTRGTDELESSDDDEMESSDEENMGYSDDDHF